MEARLGPGPQLPPAAAAAGASASVPQPPPTQPPAGHPAYIAMQQPAYASYYAAPMPGQLDYGRVPAAYQYQQPGYTQGHYVDPYAAASYAQPPHPPHPPQRPDDPDGAIFNMPPGGWAPRENYWRTDRARRQTFSGRFQAKRYNEDDDYDNDEEEDDEGMQDRLGRRHTVTQTYVRRRRSSSRRRPARMTPVTQVNSFAGGYAGVSLHGSDTIKITNLQGREVVHRVQATLDHFWSQKCELSQDGFNWTFKLAGRPWTATGDEGIRAKRTLTRLYTTLANCGYTFVCTTNVGKLLSPPSQLFEANDKTGISATATFVGLTISSSKRKITIIDLPPPLAARVRDLVRNYFPDCGLNGFPPRSAAYDTGEAPQMHEDELLAQGIVIIRLPGLFDRVPNFGTPRQYETSLENVMGHLKFVLDSAGFSLTATIPLDLPLVTIRGRRELILYRALGMYYAQY